MVSEEQCFRFSNDKPSLSEVKSLPNCSSMSPFDDIKIEVEDCDIKENTLNTLQENDDHTEYKHCETSSMKAGKDLTNYVTFDSSECEIKMRRGRAQGLTSCLHCPSCDKLFKGATREMIYLQQHVSQHHCKTSQQLTNM